MSKLNEHPIEFSPICKMLTDLQTNINPDIQWSSEEIVREAVDECWNLDEFSEEGYFALKLLFRRLMIPKEHWNDIEYKKFYGLVLDKYKERLNEDAI